MSWVFQLRHAWATDKEGVNGQLNFFLLTPDNFSLLLAVPKYNFCRGSWSARCCKNVGVSCTCTFQLCAGCRISPSHFPALVVPLLQPSFLRNVCQRLRLYHKKRHWILHPVESAASFIDFSTIINLHSAFHAGITTLYHSLQALAATDPQSLSDPWKSGYLWYLEDQKEILHGSERSILGLLDVLTVSRFLFM